MNISKTAAAVSKLRTLLGAAVVAGAASSASAAIMEASFDLRAGGNVNNQSVLSYTANGINLNVTGLVCGDSAGPNDASCKEGKIDRSSYYGIYFYQHNDSDHHVDGQYSNEFLKLSFDKTVTMKSVKFSFWDSNDNAYFYTFTGLSWNLAKNIHTGSDFWYQYDFASDFTGSMFSIGAKDSDDEWKLKKISVTYDDTPPAVPLPAAAWLMLAGLGSLAGLRSRKG